MRQWFWLQMAKALRFVTRWVASWGPGPAMNLEGTLDDMDETIADWERGDHVVPPSDLDTPEVQKTISELTSEPKETPQTPASDH